MVLASIKLPLLISLIVLFVLACIVILIVETSKIKIVNYEINNRQVSRQISNDQGIIEEERHESNCGNGESDLKTFGT